MNSRKSSKRTKKLGKNPKDRIANKKISLTKFPPVALIHGAHAMNDGAAKYGPYNWRENAVIASIYIDAAMRHLLSWFDGEEAASDSEVHHLGHAMACCAILLDAQATGNLIDDRPPVSKTEAVKLMKRLQEKFAQRAKRNGKAA